MTHIKIKKGLNISLKGASKSFLQKTFPCSLCALDLSAFEMTKFSLLVKEGDLVTIGQPLAEDKFFPDRKFVSPASGIIHCIERGFKRRLLHIVIKKDAKDVYFEGPSINIEKCSKDELIAFLLQRGILSQVKSRPCNVFANPKRLPKSIFVKAIASAPFSPPPELEVEGFEEAFQKGLDALCLIAGVHLVYRQDSACTAFLEAENVEKHTAEGPHPIGNASIHISHIDPIRKSEDVIWTLDVHDVICLGKMVLDGKYHNTKIISLAGEGIDPNVRGYVRLQKGANVGEILDKKCNPHENRLISGDPLTGMKVSAEDFIGFTHNVLCAIPQMEKRREFLHFFRLGRKKYTATRAYFTQKFQEGYPFNTLQHGEERAFVDGSIYDKVMPLPLPTMFLIKAILAEDFEKAEDLGLLDVDSEDFALPTFICPSKIDMVQIVKEGLKKYAAEYLH